MMTTRELCNVLADALGIGREAVNTHARALREAGLFSGDGADQALPAHAASLLIALMTRAPPDKVSNAARLYASLPLSSVPREATAEDGQSLGVEVPAEFTTFGTLLEWLIGWFNETSEIDFEMTRIALGGGPGTAQAVIYYTYFTDRGEVPYEVNFSLVPFGAGYLPDDAAPARLDGLRIMSLRRDPKVWGDLGDLKAELLDLWIMQKNALFKRVVLDVKAKRKALKR